MAAALVILGALVSILIGITFLLKGVKDVVDYFRK